MKTFSAKTTPIFSALLVAAGAFALSAHAAEPIAKASTKTAAVTTTAHPTHSQPGGALPAVLEALGKNGLKTEKEFTVPIGGLRGFVVRDVASGGYSVVYTTPDGEGLMAGMLVDKKGANLTAQYHAEHIPKPDHTPAFKAFSAGGEAVGVTVGAAGAKAEIVVLFDANCGFCKLMHRLVAPAIAAGELKVRYVPVAILGADSPHKGAGILASKDLTATMDAIGNNTPYETSSDKSMLDKVQSNTRLMTKHGFNGTPVVLYKTVNGKDETIHLSNGLPNMGALFKTLGISGQIEKLQADPQLARYLK